MSSKTTKKNKKKLFWPVTHQVNFNLNEKSIKMASSNIKIQNLRWATTRGVVNEDPLVHDVSTSMKHGMV